MIHTCTLPRVNCERLTDIVHLQLDLLRFAATTETCNEEDYKDHCRAYFDQDKCIYAKFRGRGETIVDNWLWEPGTTARHKSLVTFAQACSCDRNKGGEEVKENDIPTWLLSLYAEIECLLDLKCTTLTFGKPFEYPHKPSRRVLKVLREQGTLHWKEYAKDFLLSFYEEYLGKSTSSRSKTGHFPAGLFTTQGVAEGYGRQEFLREFFYENTHLDICPSCDEVLLYIRSEDIVSTDIDHFLPKDQYPHLSCHPYNLVPVCNPCNSRMKSTRDPLSTMGNPQLTLQRASLPYGKTKLHSHGYLRVTFTKKEGATKPLERAIHIREMELVPHNHLPDGCIKSDVDEIIDLLKKLYRIPERWKERKRPSAWGNEDEEGLASQICETLMRRIHHSLGSAVIMQQDAVTTRQDLYESLSRLLYRFGHYDLGKDPHVFAMLWLLTTWLRDEIQPALDSGQRSLLVEELTWWPTDYSVPAKERIAYIEQLLQQLG